LAIVAGIDEAGFGPLLGPLVVTGVAFRVPDSQAHRCLWETLRETCTRRPDRDAHRLAVADSKQLFRGRTDFSALERPAMVMLAAAGLRPRTWRTLLDLLARDATLPLERCPWYAGQDVDLPLSAKVGDIGTRANAVRRNMDEQGVEFVGVFAEPILEEQFNRLVSKTGNKAVAMLGTALRVVDRILRGAPDPRVRLCVDRLGGRVHYREALNTAFPQFEIQILEESADRSAYRLASSARVCRLEFVTGGEDRHFAIALASVYSKYLRELYMHVFNAYWSRQVAALRPTAGYYTDAKRWLNDAAAELDRLGIDRATLVRQR
jgi:ribonuclease HII